MWLAVDKYGIEIIFTKEPSRKKHSEAWRGAYEIYDNLYMYPIPGTIHKLIGRTLTWADEAVEVTKYV